MGRALPGADSTGARRGVAWDFAGSVAIVSGASSGIGLAASEALIAAGATVYGFGTSPQSTGFAQYSDRHGSKSRYDSADVTDLDQLARVREIVRADVDAQVGTVNCLVVNAGIGLRKEFLATSPEDLRRVIDVNLYGAMLTLHTFAPLLVDSGGGSVVVTSSVVHRHGMWLRAAYGATKGGLASLVRALAVEWGPAGVRVNAVAPGVVNTDLVKDYALEHPDRRARVEHSTPLGRLAEASDVADAVMYLLSDASHHVSGEVLAVDGGFTAGSAIW